MIYISCGHEKGVGLELFIKACLFFGQEQLNKLTLCCDLDDLYEHALSLNINQVSIAEKKITLFSKKINFLPIHQKYKDCTKTIGSLKTILDIIKNDDILLTLPSSKDQFIEKDKQQFNGHTQYFRHLFKKELSMFFYSNDVKALLLTDHIPLSEVEKTISKEFISIHIDNFENSHPFISKKTKSIIFTGINPHSGEGGLIGKNDYLINEFINQKKTHSTYTFVGPVSGDIAHLYFAKDNLIVYSFHDQALAPFKLYNGLIGSNITLGMPYLRLSVDHGCAFDLYKQNKANAIGLIYNIKLAIKINQYEIHKNN